MADYNVVVTARPNAFDYEKLNYTNAHGELMLDGDRLQWFIGLDDYRQQNPVRLYYRYPDGHEVRVPIYKRKDYEAIRVAVWNTFQEALEEEHNKMEEANERYDEAPHCPGSGSLVPEGQRGTRSRCQFCGTLQKLICDNTMSWHKHVEADGTYIKPEELCTGSMERIQPPEGFIPGGELLCPQCSTFVSCCLQCKDDTAEFAYHRKPSDSNAVHEGCESTV